MKFFKQLRKGIGLVVFILLLVTLVGCQKGDGGTDKSSAAKSRSKEVKSKEIITFRYQSGASYGSIAPFEVAEKLGYYKGTGVKIKSVGISKSGPEDIQAVAAGSNDVAWSNTAPVINAYIAGLKLKIVAPYGSPITKNAEGKEISTGGILVHKDSGIKSAKDLIGKKVSVNVRSAQAEYTIIKWLEENGVNPDEVELVVLAPPNEVQAIQNKQLDAAYSWSPNYEKAQEDPNIKVLVAEGDMLGDFAPGGFALSQEFIDENPEAVREFVKGIAKAWNWGWENPKEWQEISKEIIKDVKGNVALAEYAYPPGERENALFKDSDVEFYIKQLIKLGKVKEGQVKPGDIYTNEFNPYGK